jgi:hypothetical protein
LGGRRLRWDVVYVVPEDPAVLLLVNSLASLIALPQVKYRDSSGRILTRTRLLSRQRIYAQPEKPQSAAA